MPRTVKQNNNLQAGQPAKPTNLSDRAAREWDRLVGELASSNITLTPGHRTALSTAATLSADIADAWEAVKRDGAYIVGKAGIVAHPASKRLDALRREFASEKSDTIPPEGARVWVSVENVGHKEIVVGERFGFMTDENGLKVVPIYAHHPVEFD